MAIWPSCITASTEGPDEGSGFMRADTAQETVRLVGHPEVNVYPCHDHLEMPKGRDLVRLGPTEPDHRTPSG